MALSARVARIAQLGTAALPLLFALSCRSPAPSPGPLPSGPPPASAPHEAAPHEAAAQVAFTPADFERHIVELKKRLPPGFTVRVEPPFVVIGDGDPRAVEHQAVSSVRWATDRLKQDYFSRDPAHILDVWLFKDAESYRRHTKALFDETPTTPYGYYSSKHRSLIMNIATGGGTLVHEIVHPFVEANYPGAPPWFNEGLGSLYEACGEEDGHIHGYPNWRLPALQKAILKGTVPSFERLTSQDEHQFYEEDPGTNYAQARYLLYYLQQKRLLVRFYRELQIRRSTDPTGYETLKLVLGETDMDDFKRRWERFVLTLSFP